MRLEDAENISTAWIDGVVDMRADDTAEALARFILRAVPLIRAAEEWRDRKYPTARSWRTDAIDSELVSTVDAFRSGDK